MEGIIIIIIKIFFFFCWETGWERDQFVRIYLIKKVFIEVIWSYFGLITNFFGFLCITSLFLEMISHYLFQFFGTVPSYCLHYRRFFLYGLGQYIPWECASWYIWSGMHNRLVVVFLQVNKSVLSLYDLSGVLTISSFQFFLKLCFHSHSVGLISNNLLFFIIVPALLSFL